MSKPISPTELASYKAQMFPDFVFEAFNQLIAAGSTGPSTIIVKQDAVIDKMIALAADSEELTRSQIFSRGYLNVEDCYRAEGWKVEYDKPAYCENYDAFFTFKAAKQ